MRYLTFYVKPVAYEKWLTWCKDTDRDPEEEEKYRTGDIERGAGVMDYYFRLLCIAAYRHISEKDQDQYGGYSKDVILEALLDICPPDSSKLTSQDKDMNTLQMENYLGMVFPALEFRYQQPPLVNMKKLEKSYELKRRLSTIGLGPMFDWVSMGYQHEEVPGSMIVDCASMFTQYLAWVPAKKEDLEKTPYATSSRIEDNLDGKGCVEYVNVLEPAFRNTALFGDDGYAKHE